MTFKERLATISAHLGASMLAVAMLSWTPSAVAEVTNRILAVADFGSHSGVHDNPDGLDDLLWLQFPSGQVYIQYMNEDGLFVRNKAGSIDHILVLSQGSGYFTDDELVVTNNFGNSGQLQASPNVVGPVSEVTIIDPGRDYITPPGGLLDHLLIDGNPNESGGTGFSYVYELALGAAPGEVAEIQVRDGGSGYPPGVPGVDGNGDGDFCDPGEGDIPMAPRPLVLIAWHPSGDMAKSALATVWVDDTGAIMDDSVASSCGFGAPSILPDQNGSGYFETPSWEFFPDPDPGGSGAVFQAVLHRGIKNFFDGVPLPGGPPAEPNLSDGGDGYRQDPDIQFVDPGPEGTDAKFEIVRGPGPVTNVDILHPGQGYSSPPTVSLPRSGSGAILKAVLNTAGTRPLMITGTPNLAKMSWLNVKAYPGDFDGDGDMDIYFRHPKKNPSFIWFMERGEILEAQALPREMSHGWRVIGTGDFDLDGDDEIYWFNSMNGSTTIWNIDHVPGQPDQWIGPGTSFSSRISELPWRPVLILETSEYPGTTVYWYNHALKMGAIRKRNPDSTQYTFGTRVLVDVDGNMVLAGPGFVPRIAGDFDLDGLRDDLLWQNVDDGRIAMWIMDEEVVEEVTILTYQGEGEPIIAWDPVGAGSYSAISDGRSSTPYSRIFWQCGGADISWIWSLEEPGSSSDSILGSFADLFLGMGSSTSSSEGLSDVGNVYRIAIEGWSSLVSSVDIFGEGDDGGSGSGSGDYDINQFDPNNTSTWPDGITNSIAMIGWLTFNVTAADPSSWPDSVNTEEELTVWLAQQVAALSGL